MRASAPTDAAWWGWWWASPGVVALVGLDVAGDTDELIGAGAILLAATGYAAGPMILKRHLADIEPVPMMGAATAAAAVILTPAALLAPPESTPPTEAIGALLVLGLLCTATAFVLFGALVTEVGPGRATVITYVAPVVAVALGVAVLGERPGAGAVAGLLLIIAGSWLSTDGRLPPGLAPRWIGPRTSGLRRRGTRHARARRRRERRGRHAGYTSCRTPISALTRSEPLQGGPGRA